MGQESFRMVIDNTFLIQGRGTVVTGIVESGSVKKGDNVTLFSASNDTLITSTIKTIVPKPPSDNTDIETIGLLIYSEKFYAMAKKGMYLVSVSERIGK